MTRRTKAITKLSILHLSTTSSWGGGEQQLIYLYQALQQKSVSQLILCPTHSQLFQYCDKHRLHTVGYLAHRGVLHLMRCLSQQITSCRIVIIHAHDAHAHTIALMTKLIFRLSIQLVVSRKVNFQKKWSWLSRYKYNSRYLSRIICVSEAVRNTMAPLVKDSRRLTVVYDSVDLDRFKQRRQAPDIRALFDIHSNVYLVGTIAALVPSKGLEIIIAVAKALRNSGLSVAFLMIGAGPLQAKLQQLIHQAALEKQVILMGFRSDIPAILPSLDVLMMPSREEGLGSTLLEAMACQVPVIATRAGGIPELVKEEETGLLVDIDDVASLTQALIRLLLDPLLRTQLTENATQQLEKFSPNLMAEKTLVVYERSICLKNEKFY